MNKPIVYIDMDNTICDFRGSHEAKKTDKMQFPQATYGFWVHLWEITGACDTIKALAKDFDIYFATAPSERNLMCYTEKAEWIQAKFGQAWLNKLIIIPHKELLKGDYLVDDMVKGKGQDKFEGELLQFGSDTFPTWGHIENYLAAENSHEYGKL